MATKEPVYQPFNAVSTAANHWLHNEE